MIKFDTVDSFNVIRELASGVDVYCHDKSTRSTKK